MIPPNSRCLDVGCGDGVVGHSLLALGHEYVGVDVSARAISAARDEGLDALQIRDAGDLPFDDATCDVAICIEVLEHLFRPDLALREMHRVLRPGGLLILTVPNVGYWRRRLDLALLGRWNPMGDHLSVREPWRDPHIRFFNHGILRRILRSTSFDIIETGGLDGSAIRDIPWIGPRVWGGTTTTSFDVLQRLLPSLLGLRLYAVARRSTALADKS